VRSNQRGSLPGVSWAVLDHQGKVLSAQGPADSFGCGRSWSSFSGVLVENTVAGSCEQRLTTRSAIRSLETAHRESIAQRAGMAIKPFDRPLVSLILGHSTGQSCTVLKDPGLRHCTLYLPYRTSAERSSTVPKDEGQRAQDRRGSARVKRG